MYCVVLVPIEIKKAHALVLNIMFRVSILLYKLDTKKTLISAGSSPPVLGEPALMSYHHRFRTVVLVSEKRAGGDAPFTNRQRFYKKPKVEGTITKDS